MNINRIVDIDSEEGEGRKEDSNASDESEDDKDGEGRNNERSVKKAKDKRTTDKNAVGTKSSATSSSSATAASKPGASARVAVEDGNDNNDEDQDDGTFLSAMNTDSRGSNSSSSPCNGDILGSVSVRQGILTSMRNPNVGVTVKNNKGHTYATHDLGSGGMALKQDTSIVNLMAADAAIDVVEEVRKRVVQSKRRDRGDGSDDDFVEVDEDDEDDDNKDVKSKKQRSKHAGRAWLEIKRKAGELDRRGELTLARQRRDEVDESDESDSDGEDEAKSASQRRRVIGSVGESGESQGADDHQTEDDDDDVDDNDDNHHHATRGSHRKPPTSSASLSSSTSSSTTLVTVENETGSASPVKSTSASRSMHRKPYDDYVPNPADDPAVQRLLRVPDIVWPESVDRPLLENKRHDVERERKRREQRAAEAERARKAQSIQQLDLYRNMVAQYPFMALNKDKIKRM